MAWAQVLCQFCSSTMVPIGPAAPPSCTGTPLLLTVMFCRRLQRVQVLPAYRVQFSSSSWVTEKSTDSGSLMSSDASYLLPLNGPKPEPSTLVLPSDRKSTRLNSSH